MNSFNIDYQAPLIEVIEISVEKGFAGSTSAQDLGDGFW